MNSVFITREGWNNCLLARPVLWVAKFDLWSTSCPGQKACWGWCLMPWQHLFLASFFLTEPQFYTGVLPPPWNQVAGEKPDLGPRVSGFELQPLLVIDSRLIMWSHSVQWWGRMCLLGPPKGIWLCWCPGCPQAVPATAAALLRVKARLRSADLEGENLDFCWHPWAAVSAGCESLSSSGLHLDEIINFSLPKAGWVCLRSRRGGRPQSLSRPRELLVIKNFFPDARAGLSPIQG